MVNYLLFGDGYSMRYKDVLSRALVCLFAVLGLSAAGLVINLWLGLERNLAGNLGAVVITALLLYRCKGLSLTGNLWLLVYFSTVCAMGGVLFLMVLAGLSPIGPYTFHPLSLAEAALAFSVNALAFMGTIKFVSRRGN